MSLQLQQPFPPSINAASRSIAPLVGTTIALAYDFRAAFAATALLYLSTGIMAAWRLPTAETSSKAN